MVDPAKIAAILGRLHKLGSVRRTPEADDLPGDFEGWFDGGAFRSVTGATSYTFADGTQANVAVQPWLTLSIRFVDGTEVSVIERPHQSSGQVCAGCGGAVDPSITHQIIDGQTFHVGCVA